MKKFMFVLMTSILLFPFFVFAEENLAANAKSAILVENSTGKVLFEKNSNEKVAIASLTKMMSQIIILENIESGNLSWDEIVKVSANAAGYGGTQIYLQPGEEMSVRDLFKGVSMASANDAVVALAERIAGTEANFVKMMMEKAKELGLKNTNFVNPTGLDEQGHYSTAYDLSIIARELLTHEQILEFSSLYEDYLRVDTPNKFWLVNTNKLVRFYEGADGLKTGFTDDAKYCMTVTAKRDNMRLIAIVLGEDVSKVRNAEVTELLDYGFNLYKVNLVKEKNEVVDKIKLEKSNLNEIEIVTESEISILSKKSEESRKYTEKIVLDDIKLPLKSGTVVGKLQLLDGSSLIGEYNLIVNQDISKKNLFSLFFDNLKDIMIGAL
ncbi:MAG: D-alanyl-D-alanine carboxypeptidase [Firmicutes bacterium]|nr:D-alanyl-D-alanine carboxypeptidase [Bacillota bacterium]